MRRTYSFVTGIHLHLETERLLIPPERYHSPIDNINSIDQTIVQVNLRSHIAHDSFP